MSVVVGASSRVRRTAVQMSAGIGQSAVSLRCRSRSFSMMACGLRALQEVQKGPGGRVSRAALQQHRVLADRRVEIGRHDPARAVPSCPRPATARRSRVRRCRWPRTERPGRCCCPARASASARRRRRAPSSPRPPPRRRARSSGLAMASCSKRAVVSVSSPVDAGRRRAAQHEPADGIGEAAAGDAEPLATAFAGRSSSAARNTSNGAPWVICA